MKKLTKKQIGILWKVGFLFLLGFVFIQSYFYEKSIEANPYELTAEILKIENCFKNGRCLVYKYEYENKTYVDRTRTTWTFSNWCENRNDCKTYKFKLTIDKDDPEKNIADWDAIFEGKNLIK